MKRIAVVSASGIGDALIVHIASHNFAEAGWEVTTFSDHLPSFGHWLKGYRFAPQPPLEDIADLFLDRFDAVFLQHDNSQKAKKIASLPLQVYIFYGAHQIGKHPPIQRGDYVCDPNQSMVDNIVQATGKIIGACSKENGLRAPPELVFRKYPKRIAIHPTSQEETRNWPRENYFLLKKLLEKKGFEPVFTVSCKEAATWEAPTFSNLQELSSFLYESGGFIGNDSGLGHIASYLQLPLLTIGKSERHLKLWRPGWRTGAIITPSKWSSYFKWTRNKWKLFIPVQSVFKSFMKIPEFNYTNWYK